MKKPILWKPVNCSEKEEEEEGEEKDEPGTQRVIV